MARELYQVVPGRESAERGDAAEIRAEARARGGIGA